MLNFNNEDGLTLGSFLVSLLLSTMFLLSLIQYCHSLTVWLSVQQVELDGQRFSFQQIEAYPELILYDTENWSRRIKIVEEGSDCYYLTIDFVHKSGYSTSQTRMQCRNVV